MNGAKTPNRFKPLRALLTMAAIILAVPLLGRGCGSCMGYQDLVMARVNACPAATELLGAPIKESLIGLSCGSARSGGGAGRASWTTSVSGPKARGRYSFHVEQQGGPWRFVSGTLKAGGKTINVATCSTVGTGEGMRAVRQLTGVVDSTVGAAPVGQGVACTATVTPGEGDDPCRAVVRCGDATIYGATSKTGYAHCSVERSPDGRPGLVVQDTDFTPQGGDPALDLRESRGQLVVSDQVASGMWVVNIKLATGQPASAPASAAAPAPTPAAAPAATPAPVAAPAKP